jgi:hypothetical protein
VSVSSGWLCAWRLAPVADAGEIEEVGIGEREVA